jgi:hypothetical protein
MGVLDSQEAVGKVLNTTAMLRHAPRLACLSNGAQK